MWVVCYCLWSCLWTPVSLYTTDYVLPSSFVKLSKDITLRDFGNTFDNNLTTPGLIYSDISEKVKLLITLPMEHQIFSVEILSDIPSQLKHSVLIGYATDESSPSPSLAYECVPNTKSTFCQPSCMQATTGQDREGVVGLTILWTFERLDKKDWTRIYDVLIRGRPFSERMVIQDKLADIVFLKPYYNRALGVDYEKESCLEPVWKLTDSSVVNQTTDPISKFNRNVTIYFGGSYSVNNIVLVISQTDEPIKGLTLRFGGLKPMVKYLDFGKDCKEEHASGGQLLCSLSELESYPFNNVTLDVKGLVRLNVYGMPFYYPYLRLFSSQKSAKPEDRLELKCVSISCGSNNAAAKLLSSFQHAPKGYCTQYGRNVECKNMQLVRTHKPLENGRLVIPDTLLVADGKVVDGVEMLMTELTVVKATKNEITVGLPRTHAYYGQYKCRCSTEDELVSLIESKPSNLSATDFDQGDVVFERNYSAIYRSKPIENTLGFFVLSEGRQGHFFQLVVAGHSLFERINLSVTFTEQGSRTSVPGRYAVTTPVQAFPRATGAMFAWPIPAYKIELQEAYPDYVDDQLIEVDWRASEKSISNPIVKDKLRTIVVSANQDEFIRVWLWNRDVRQLDIRAFYQTKFTSSTNKQFYLQRKGCNPQETAEKLGSIMVTDTDCTSDQLSDSLILQCQRTDSGYAMQFIVTNASASDVFNLIEQNSTTTSQTNADKELLHLPELMENLQSEVDSTKYSLSIVSLSESQNEEELTVTLGVFVHSKIIVDSSACRLTFIKLSPSWSVSEQPEAQLTSNQTEFTLNVPKSERVLTMDVTLRVESKVDTEPAQISDRSISILNPLSYDVNLTLGEKNGEFQWPPIIPQLKSIHKEFDVELHQTIKVCGSYDDMRAPEIRQNAVDGYNIIRLSDIPDFTSSRSVEYELRVTPVFAAKDGTSIRGKKSESILKKGKMGQTILRWDESRNSRTARIFVIPTQAAKCLIDNSGMLVQFNLQLTGHGDQRPSHLDDVRFEPEGDRSSTDMSQWYIVKNLLPGHRYKVNAMVLYPTGASDELSLGVQFQTNDEVTVSDNRVFASPGDKITFNCSGTVGPQGTYQKRLEWKRQDETPVPDGVIQETITHPTAENGWKQTVSLNFKKVERGQAAVYACFIEPSVLELVGEKNTPPTTKLYISVLELSSASKQAKIGDLVMANCSSQQDGHPTWYSPDDKVIQVGGASDGQDVFISVEKDPANAGHIAVLNIHSVTLEQTGDYTCRQLGNLTERTFNLHLNQDVNVYFADDTSNKAGEKLHLNCEGHLGTNGTSLEWFRRMTNESSWSSLTGLRKKDPSINLTTSSITGNSQNGSLTLINSPSSVGEYACVVIDMQQANTGLSELPSTNSVLPVNFQPAIFSVEKRMTPEGEVLLECAGYPATETDRLQWIYLPEGKEAMNELGTVPINRHDIKLNENLNESLLQTIRSTFRLGDNIPATWLGISSPRALALAEKISISNDETAIVTPQRLQLIINSGKPDFKLPEILHLGSLSCQYRQAKFVVPIGHEPDAHLSTRSANIASLHKEILLNTIFDPETGKSHEISSSSGKLKSSSPTLKFNGNWIALLALIKIMAHYL